MKICGYVKNKNNIPIEDASIEIKNEHFETVYQTLSDNTGYYEISSEATTYPFLTAVKSYGVNFLEYWCQNIDLSKDVTLNLSFDRLEIYGLHVFSVKGSMPALMVYFRPMSLDKFKACETDISPEIEEITVTIDNTKAEIYCQNKVNEFIGDRNVTSYLLQVSGTPGKWKFLSIEIKDTSGNYGKADIFNN